MHGWSASQFRFILSLKLIATWSINLGFWTTSTKRDRILSRLHLKTKIVKQTKKSSITIAKCMQKNALHGHCQSTLVQCKSRSSLRTFFVKSMLLSLTQTLFLADQGRPSYHIPYCSCLHWRLKCLVWVIFGWKPG